MISPALLDTMPSSPPSCLQLVVVPAEGEAAWEDGPNRSFSLAIPKDFGDVMDPQSGLWAEDKGSFLIMLHHDQPSSSTEAIFFPRGEHQHLESFEFLPS